MRAVKSLPAGVSQLPGMEVAPNCWERAILAGTRSANQLPPHQRELPFLNDLYVIF